ncbi:MAG TPA: hypothetical protein VGE01_08045 [Fimbriimonas sp.]
MGLRNLLVVLVAAVALGGCGQRDDGVKAEDRRQLADVNTLAMKVGGDFDKLTPEEQKPILAMAHGDEERARRLCFLIANPPNKPRGGLPGPGGPPGGR